MGSFPIQSQRMMCTLLYLLRKSRVFSQRFLLLQQESAWRAARKKNTTMDDAMATAQTVRRTMATAMAAGIMDTTTSMDVGLAAIEAAVEWTKERHRCLVKRKTLLRLHMM